MSSPARSTRLAASLSAVLLPVGSILFTIGGARHPQAGTAFGSVGTPEFFRAFAEHITHQANWGPVHAMILIGPLLWALGAPGRLGAAADASDVTASGVIEGLASRALTLGAALWAVVFAIDGFVSPQVAQLIGAAGDSAAPLAVFRNNQAIVISLGLVSWLLIGIAIAFYGAAMLIRKPIAGSRAALGAGGVVVGLWPVVATITGEFNPGPFTSRLWNVTALASAFWFAALGVSLLVRDRIRVPTAARANSPTLAPLG